MPPVTVGIEVVDGVRALRNAHHLVVVLVVFECAGRAGRRLVRLAARRASALCAAEQLPIIQAPRDLVRPCERLKVHRDRVLRTDRPAPACVAGAKLCLTSCSLHHAGRVPARNHSPTLGNLPIRTSTPAVTVCVEVVHRVQTVRHRNCLRHDSVVVERAKHRATIDVPRNLARPRHRLHRHIHSGRLRDSIALCRPRQREGALASSTLHQAVHLTASKPAPARVEQLPPASVPAVAVRVVVAESMLASRKAQVLHRVAVVRERPKHRTLINLPRDLIRPRQRVHVDGHRNLRRTTGVRRRRSATSASPRSRRARGSRRRRRVSCWSGRWCHRACGYCCNSFVVAAAAHRNDDHNDQQHATTNCSNEGLVESCFHFDAPRGCRAGGG